MCRYFESAASPHRRTPTRRPTRCSARRRFRSVRSYGMKGIASIGLAAIMGAALASCTALAPSDEQGAGNSPDLVVAPPSVSDGGPAAGGQFTLSATVRNSGGGAAAATTLRYYQSTDAAIARSDMEVGTDAVAALAASGSGRESVSLVAPSTPGTYYYGACVDAATGETETANNCSTSVQVMVHDTLAVSHGHPDLMVTSPLVSDSGPAAGGKFTLSATVRNAGGGAADATTLRYLRSADERITTSDTEVATDSVAELAATGSGSQSVELTAPTTPGT